MKNISNLLFLTLAVLGSCTNEDDATVTQWEILALEYQVTELNEQNEALSLILKKMNSNHVSIRYFTTGLVDDIERVKRRVIDFANDDAEPEINASRQIISTKGRVYPRSFTFKHAQIPRKLTHLVTKSLSAFDKHPSTDGSMLDLFLSEVNPENPNEILRNEMFDGLNLGQTVQLLELVQIKLLMEENKYLTAQFDHAINRLIVYSAQ